MDFGVETPVLGPGSFSSAPISWGLASASFTRWCWADVELMLVHCGWADVELMLIHWVGHTWWQDKWEQQDWLFGFEALGWVSTSTSENVNKWEHKSTQQSGENSSPTKEKQPILPIQVRTKIDGTRDSTVGVLRSTLPGKVGVVGGRLDAQCGASQCTTGVDGEGNRFYIWKVILRWSNGYMRWDGRRASLMVRIRDYGVSLANTDLCI